MSDKFTVGYSSERTVGPFRISVGHRGDVTVTVTSPDNGDVKTSPLLFGQVVRTADCEIELTGRSGSKASCQFRVGTKKEVPRRKLVRRASKKHRESR